MITHRTGRSARSLLRHLTLLALVLLVLSPLARGQGPEATAGANRLVETRQQLQGIDRSLAEIRARIEQLRRELETAEDEDQRESITEQLQQLEAQRRSLRQTFADLAVGGLDLTVFSDQPVQEDLNWQDELLSILRPVFSEMRQLTERPRAIERLRRDRALIEQRLTVADQALENIRAIPTADLQEAALARLQEMEQGWRERQADLLRQRGIVQLQIDTLLERHESIYDQVDRAVREFLVGRGLTLILAIAALLLTLYLLIGGMNLLMRYREHKGNARRGSRTRLFLLGYRMLAVLLAALVFLMVLFAAGDLVLFALALVVLLALLLSFRVYLPRYIAEARLFLNVGEVRESERLIYHGVPWRVEALGWYSRLVNPELENGELRVPIAELVGKVSRPVPNEEPWFPCRAGEYVLLGDDTFGLVERQTPEIVQLKVRGNSVIYATTDFLAARPRSLSRGSFVAFATFGIDYRHQPIATTEVAPVLRQGVVDTLADSPVADLLTDVLVEFKEAGASSLDYLIVLTLDGAAASYYFKLGRLIQTACVDVCNARGWVIPFNQLTVHQGEGFEALSSASTRPEG